MKTLLIYLIRGYQILPFASHKACRFTPTCSEYMCQAIATYGVIKGVKLGLKRLARCRPGGPMGIDEVPKWEDK